MERLKNELGFDFPTLTDPKGTITDRFGIMIWPTTVTLDHARTISSIETGPNAESLEDDVGHTENAE